MRPYSILIAAVAYVFLAITAVAAGDTYLIGAGKADITGPVVEQPFSGYGMLNQKGTGLRQRVYARAFIIGDEAGKDRFVYLIVDAAFGDTAIRRGIIEGVQALGGEYSVYSNANVAVVGTHSHSGLGGWNNYVLPLIPTLGFNKQAYNAIVTGGVLAIKRAHESLSKGTLDVATADVVDGNINRSLWAYLQNPQSERDQYGSSTDTSMTLLRMKRADGKIAGIITWYAAHPTSLYNNNTIVTGDNKGVAAYLFEREFAADSRAAPGFVAGFSNANVGDTSPNILGAWCEDGSGVQCNEKDSTCPDGSSYKCQGRGPFFAANDFGAASCYEMARRQYATAKNIYNSIDSSSTAIVGPTVKAFHYFHDMRWFKFPGPDGQMVQTCPAALGYSFAAGATDGPGEKGFVQGDSGKPDANPFWQFVSGALKTPTPEQKACQGAKPILLDIGEIDVPYAWGPSIIDVQMFRVGQFIIIVAPTEATTMAGRRWRNAVATAAKSIIDTTPIVVIGGPANTYSHYTTTPEEYDVQRYEGASTLYGKWTLYAHINLTTSAIQYLAPGSTTQPPPGPSPPDTRSQGITFLTDVVLDAVPIGKSFGQCISQPAASYKVGAVISATFQGANPRNNFRLEGTFAAVEKQQSDGSWVQVRDDKDWFLVYKWERTNLILGHSTVTLSWETEKDGVEPGTYRFKYYGDKKLFGVVTAFTGVSNSFTISA